MLIYKAFGWVQHLQNLTFSDLNLIKNPNTLTRMPPTQYPLSGIAAPPPNSRDAFPSLQQGADPLGWAQGDPREPQGAQGYLRAPSAPLGGMGPRGPLGLYRSHSEWNPVSIGWLLRNDSEIKTVAGKPSERKGFKVLPKPLEDQGGLGSEIMPRYAQMVHGQHWARNNQTICTKTDHLVACAAADLK